MKDIVSSGSFEMSDMTNTCGFLSMVIAGGHCWAATELPTRPARSRLTLRDGILLTLL